MIAIALHTTILVDSPAMFWHPIRVSMHCRECVFLRAQSVHSYGSFKRDSAGGSHSAFDDFIQTDFNSSANELDVTQATGNTSTQRAPRIVSPTNGRLLIPAATSSRAGSTTASQSADVPGLQGFGIAARQRSDLPPRPSKQRVSSGMLCVVTGIACECHL